MSSVSARGAEFLRAALSRFTWRGFWSLQALGAAFNLLRFLQTVGSPHPPKLLLANTVITSVAPLVGMLAAYCADEACQRGRPAWRSYVVALAVLCLSFVAFQDVLRHVFALPFEGPSKSALTNEWLWVGDDFLSVLGVGGVALLAYYNRRSVERMVERLRAAELRRVRLARELLASRLATAQAEVDPASLFGSLAGIRALYGDRPAEADRALERLIEELRSRRDAQLIALGESTGSPRV
jgi:hypothetical protein